jgi:hypothetical protein
MLNSQELEDVKTTRENTIPFHIICDKRTVEIASVLLQQATLAAYGSSKVSALPSAITKSKIYGSIVLWSLESPERLGEIERFYRNEWSALPEQKRSKRYALPVRWHIDVNDALTVISRRFPYGPGNTSHGNKSLAFCVLMAHAAKYRYDIPIPEDE